MVWLRSFCVSIIAVFVSVATSGCGRSPTIPMAGHVTLDGSNLQTGNIVLTPLAETGGPVVGCEISEGRYGIPASHGPRRSGKYRVEIRSIDPSSGSTRHPLSRGEKAVFLDRVPRFYNSESKIELLIPEDVDDLEKDFELRSKPGD